MIKNKIKFGWAVILCITLFSPRVSMSQDAVVPDNTSVVQDISDTSAIFTEEIVTEVIIVESFMTEDTQSTDTTPQESISPQDSVIEEDLVLASSVESTFDPHNTTVQSSSTPIVEMEVVPIIIETNEILPDTTSTTTTEILPPATVTITEIMEQPVQTTNVEHVAFVQLEPESKFTFDVVSGAIATKKNPDWDRSKQNNKKKVAYVTNVPTLSADNTEGVLDVSGSCADKYFVVLIYANKEDYDKNPSSYIFNKAFDCKGGSYDYSLKDLPESLPDGTYYLLIGGQGDSGSWSPITALITIIINKRLE